MSIISRTTLVPPREHIYRSARQRQPTRPARPIPPARIGGAWAALARRLLATLRPHKEQP